jgi:hypothetical protein
MSGDGTRQHRAILIFLAKSASNFRRQHNPVRGKNARTRSWLTTLQVRTFLRIDD